MKTRLTIKASKTAASKVHNIQGTSKIAWLGGVHNIPNHNIQDRGIQKRIIQNCSVQVRNIQTYTIQNRGIQDRSIQIAPYVNSYKFGFEASPLGGISEHDKAASYSPENS